MKSGYDQFFKNARKVAKKPEGVRLKLDISSEELLERELRARAGFKPQRVNKKKKSSAPWKMIGISFIGLIVAFAGFQNYEKVESIVKHIEISLLGTAHAEAAPKKAAPEKKAAEDKKTDAAIAEGEAKPEVAAPSALDLDHLQKLTERKKELDAREEELNRVEQELQAQKGELEKRMKELEEARVRISTMLEDRVKVDAEKIETLVQMYSNMKAPQAAKIFESMDEDLAVEILGKMKKKNAADIMNLLKSEKAQVFSEKFAGYKRTKS